MIDIIEQNSRIRRMPHHMVKAMYYLSELSMVAEAQTKQEEDHAEEDSVDVGDIEQIEPPLD